MQLAALDEGSPTIKSMEMTCEAPSITGKEASRPGYLTLFGLAY
jgi:hypothetical protein